MKNHLLINNEKILPIKVFGITFAFLTTANFIHPITPALFLSLNMPNYMFGVSYASMAGATFLLSPFWGRMCPKYGCKKILMFGMFFYAIAEFSFSLSTTQTAIIISRFFCGIFFSACSVSTLAYVIDISNEENRSSYMMYYSVGSTLSMSLGYFIGGFIGSVSIKAIFMTKVSTLFILVIITSVLLKKNDMVKSAKTVSVKVKASLNIYLLLFMFIVMLASFANTSYDSAFNYYVKAALNFPNYYNGIIRAGIGLVSIIMNFSLGLYLVKRTNMKQSIIGVFLLCGLASFAVFITKCVEMFIISNFIFYAFNCLYLPMQQSMMTDFGNGADSGNISGMFNSFLYIGKVGGSLFAGFIYTYGDKIPFIASSMVFLASMVFSGLLYLIVMKSNLKNIALNASLNNE